MDLICVSGRPAGDTDCLKDMGVKEKQKLMMIGSLEESIREAAKAPNPEEMPEVNVFEKICYFLFLYLKWFSLKYIYRSNLP